MAKKNKSDGMLVMHTMTLKKVGEIGVDSGQVVVMDPCYIDGEFEDTNDLYKRMCNASGEDYQLNYRRGHPGLAVCVPSGYGDGVYPVYAEIGDSGRVMKLVIDFSE